MHDRLVQAIVLVEDLLKARRQLETIGFTVREGGRHPGRGTANLIVPFGQQYLEILAVVDREEASASPQGRPVLAALARGGPGLARWSVEPADIGETARRVGEPIERRQRVLPDGTTVRWRSVGVDRAWAESWRCAFMSWDDPELHPARPAVVHRNATTGFTRLEVVVPDGPVALRWLGGREPPGVDLEVGRPPWLRDLHLSSPGGDFSLAREMSAFS